MSKSRASAGLYLEKTARGIVPASAFDEETLGKLPLGTQFRAVSMTRRSSPQHRTYWKALTHIVDSTEGWPTSAHLHDALMRDLGYLHVAHGLDGQPYVTRDSEAFNAMDQEKFQVYMNMAMKRLAEVTGIDPLAWLEQEKTK